MLPQSLRHLQATGRDSKQRSNSQACIIRWFTFLRLLLKSDTTLKRSTGLGLHIGSFFLVITARPLRTWTRTRTSVSTAQTQGGGLSWLAGTSDAFRIRHFRVHSGFWPATSFNRLGSYFWRLTSYLHAAHLKRCSELGHECSCATAPGRGPDRDLRQPGGRRAHAGYGCSAGRLPTWAGTEWGVLQRRLPSCFAHPRAETLVPTVGCGRCW